jgi:ADP-heptose:LPS heptosyltransferase
MKNVGWNSPHISMERDRLGFFPPLALINKYYIGDTVLLTGIAEVLTKEYETKVYIVSNYPELLINHPYVIPINFDQMNDLPDDCRIIDMSESIRSIKEDELPDRHGKKQIVQIPLEKKLARMFDQAGSATPIQPTLYLTDEEIEKAKNIRKLYGGKLVGIGIGSRHAFKVWAYFDILVKYLAKEFNIFIIHDNRELCDKFSKYPVKFLTNLSLRELMINIYAMDYYIGNDSGPAHIACALGVPSTVIGLNIAEELYSKYENVIFFPSNVAELKDISARKVIKKTTKIIVNENLSKSSVVRRPILYRNIDRKSKIGIFRLDGFGGSITVSDQAKKIYDKYGIKSSVIIRGNADIFKDNPYVDDVIIVGNVNWSDCFDHMAKEFGIIAEIRFALCKVHQFKFKLFDQDYRDREGLFAEFPHNYNKLEVHHLHHIQITDMEMGLPYDSIDSKVFCFEKPKIELPDNYLIVNNGVDALYKGTNQTKTWYEWNEFVSNIDLPSIQVGTEYDGEIKGAVDFRGKLSIPELFWVLRNANGVVCCEGGIMHASYACDSKNVFVLRGPTTGKLFEYPGHNFIDSYVCKGCWSITGDWYMNCPKQVNAVCMASITPERVLYNLERVLNEN